MNCMKCGKDTEGDEIFCPECQELMKKYPVKPGTVVHIPTQPVKKQTHHRRIISHEEQIRKLTRQVHILQLLVTLFCGVAIFFALMAFDFIEKANMRLPGQNYSVAGATETTEPEENEFFRNLIP